MANMSIKLTMKQVTDLGVAMRKANKIAPLTREQHNERARAKREAYKAEVLAWAIADWHRHREHLQKLCPLLWAMGVDDIPTAYTSQLGLKYKHRLNLNY